MMHSKLKSMLARSIVLFAIACLHDAAITSTLVSAQIRLNPTGNPIPPKLFGMHIHHFATRTPWPGIKFGAIRLWDSYAAWPDVEPERGKWNFAGVDKYVAQAEQNGVEVMLPLALSPAWASSRPEEKSGYGPGNAAVPANLDDWRNYVRTVATRHKGRVHVYEIWNEPNLKDFYTGSTAQLVQLASLAYQTLKEIDPTNIICSPAFTGASGLPFFDRYLQAGGGKYADVIGYHLYVNPAPPEEMAALIRQVEAIMSKNGVRNKELWDTETGWAIQNTQSEVKPSPGRGFNSIVLPLDQASAYVARTYILSWAMEVSRLYWYAWDNGVMGFTEKDGKTVKSPANAYAEVEKWLIGAVMLSCDSNADGTWVAELSRPGSYHGWIVWNPARTVNFTPPGSWKVKQVRDLAGKTERVHPDRPSISIGASPVLLESQAP